MKVSLIVAMAINGVIGRDNALPWHLPADLKQFKTRTSGHVVVMGRRTWETLDGPLPGRRNVVVTRNTGYSAEGVDIVHTLESALQLARDDGESEVFILGGSEIYRLALADADRMYVTMVDAEPEGDTYFPDIDPDAWELVDDERHEADERHEHAYSFQLYERRRNDS